MKTLFKSKSLMVMLVCMFCCLGTGLSLLFTPVWAEIQTTSTEDLWTDYAVAPAGSGTEADPYKIASAANLAWIASQTNSVGEDFSGVYFLQTAHINLSGHNWVPIGISSQYDFSGRYDGADFSIKNLTINGDYSYAGLFGYASRAAIKKLCLENTSINYNGTGNYVAVGGIAGNSAITDIESCSVSNLTIEDGRTYNSTGTVPVYLYCGGVAGIAVGEIINCGVENVTFNLDATVTSTQSVFAYVGGITGSLSSTTLSYCSAEKIYLYNSISAQSSLRLDYGGIAGAMSDEKTSIENCDAKNTKLLFKKSASATASQLRFGGIIGMLYGGAGGTIKACSVENTSIKYEGSGSVGEIYGNQASASTATVVDCVTTGCTIKQLTYWTDEGNYAVPVGSGTLANPYKIALAQNLAWIAVQTNSGTTFSGKYFEQTADIDLAGHEWVPIGINASHAFTGNYDGGGYTISNATIVSTETYYGLFGYCSGTVEITNCNLTNVSINETEQDIAAGCLIGYLAGNGARISNCSVKNSNIIGDNQEAFNAFSNRVAGLVGLGYGKSSAKIQIKNCIVQECNIQSYSVGTGYAGGILSYGNYLEIENCYVSSCTIVSDSLDTIAYAGGIATYISNSSIKNAMINSSELSVCGGTEFCGGIVCDADKITVSSCCVNNCTLSGNYTVGVAVGCAVGSTTLLTDCLFINSGTELSGQEAGTPTTSCVVILDSTSNYYYTGDTDFENWAIVNGKPLLKSLFHIASAGEECSAQTLSELGFHSGD
ncbi:MAG: hypothetical protein IJY90_03585 [Clostridia bacterium]|nr:hypothetical protein [Clostridia bacterium]